MSELIEKEIAMILTIINLTRKAIETKSNISPSVVRHEYESELKTVRQNLQPPAPKA